ncbi:hypothetical protein [Flavobacterium anhuiense]|uniref:hypothetical protein n=1 Tax=Flavobacterium anhuiense TaxID=459526 RepID=UPI0020270C05|nr:hypothetical protein [Flavobacterium anhuiense]URM37133.1 hypothetical protein LLY39_00640 [Flavobacterium anhuiense]
MAYSKISIKFALNMPAQYTYLNIGEHTRNKFFVESFRSARRTSYEVSTPTLLSPDIYTGYISTYYKQSFDLDHNIWNEYTVVDIPGEPNSGFGEVVITANYPGAVFYVILNEVPDGIFINVVNEPAIPEIKIDNVTFLQASSNQCQNVKVSVDTSILATKVLSPIVINPNSANPFSFDNLRGQTVTVLVEDSNGKQDSKTVTLPSLLNAGNFQIDVNNSPNGATVIVSNVNSAGLTLEYSLDNLTWQSSNIFSGLITGDYMLYVRDQFGCTVNKAFFVDEFGIQSPYFYISKSNSIRYAKRVNWELPGNYKNDENTLSCEVDVDQVYQEVQQFQSTDIINTQFKSNFKSLTATIVRENLPEVSIPIEKKSNNIGIKDKRDSRKYSLENGKTGLYFLSGNTYDFESNAISGTYTLNGLLPEWAVAGNYLIIGTAWFIIEEIIFDDLKNADVIVYSENFSGPETNVIVGSIYNRFNYEVYEYKVSMNSYTDQKFQVRLVNADPNFSTITYLSEEIWCKEKHEDLIEIRYRNTTNTDVFYSTGIEYLLRIPLTNIKGKVDEESELHKTDTDARLLNADLYEVDEFVFEPVTKEIWRKIMIALSHEKVWLNGVEYVKNGAFSTEGPLEKSNLYVLTANMIKTGNVYNSQGNVEFGDEDIEIPGLISTETGFVSYL